MKKKAGAQKKSSSKTISGKKLGAPETSPAKDSFAIVGLGASAGGLEAFTELLRHLPVDSGMAFVLVQHLDPQHESALTQILSRATKMPVREVTNNQRVAPNCVYVIPPNTSMDIAQGVLKLMPRAKTRAPHRSIDHFLESLAQDQHERAIGVILSGTATDGTLGLELIKAEGGITFAQDESARYDSMPRSAIAAGCVDFVLSPERIAKELARIARHPYVAGQALHAEMERDADQRGGDDAPLASGGHGTPRSGSVQARKEARAAPDKAGKNDAQKDAAENGYKKILLLLRNHCGVDFSLYKSTTIRRRIARRMVLNRQNTPESYADSLRGNAKELDALYSDVLISVTSFFRNPEAFEVLQRKVFPKLLAQRGDEPCRVWTLGCSTGQEAYSVAMAFVESAEKDPRARKLQVFATDLNEALLNKARHGLYTKSLEQDVSPERLKRFFVAEEGGYRVTKALREMVVFARQNLIGDPPFSRMDLISCRNLLIYLEPSLQQKAIPTFHYALKPDGFLFLGASESIGSFGNLFAPADKKQKIYSKKSAPTPPFHLPVGKEAETQEPAAPAMKRRGAAPDEPAGFRAELSAQREADRITVNQFAPPAVLIDAHLQILQFRGPTGAWLEPPSGKASFDVLKMAREGLMLPLRAAIDKAKKEGRSARQQNVSVKRNGRTERVNLEVIPLKNVQEKGFLIVFEDAGKPSRTNGAAAAVDAIETSRRSVQPAAKESGRRLAQLERELAETRDYLQSIQEQHEAANEELQASNEEVQSANEELQSVNEELETSKEELESTNEELTTINEEMTHRNAELSRLNDDLSNLQSSTKLAILLLGRDLGIRRFSVQAVKQFSLQASDLGRPLGNVRHRLEFPELESFVTEVINSVHEAEREVQDAGGHWYSLRVRPYFTVDNRVDGAVLVLLDIDALKRSEQEIGEARDYAEAIVNTVRDPLLILDGDLRVHTANEAFYRSFRLTPVDSRGRLIYELAKGEWNIPRLRELLEDILPHKSVFDHFQVERSFDGIGHRNLLLNARRLSETATAPARILLGIEDITELEGARMAARDNAQRFRVMTESLPQKIFTAKVNGDVDYYNPQWLEYVGLPFEQIRDWGWSVFIHPDELGETIRLWKQSVASGEPYRQEHRFRRADGEYRWHLSMALALRNEAGQVWMWVGSNTDIHDVKESDRRKEEFLATLAHELRGPLAPVRNSLEILRRADDNREARQHARETMERQMAHMIRLVDDLLDVSRMSLGKLQLRQMKVDLASVVHQAIEASRPAMDRAAQELTVTLPGEPVHLHADPVRLAQVFGNLLSNASKFTEAGGRIAIVAERQVDTVVISVKDSGIGIAHELLPNVFEMFTQGDQTLERSYGGLGIGLPLVQRLVGMHGGSVQAFSEGAGQGSEFVVRLPVLREEPVAKPADAAAAEPLAIRPRRILVVDDHRDSADSLAVLLQMTGHETRLAFDGVEAVSAAAAFRPDVILLDIGLPKLNGYDAARRIREQPWGKNTVLVALTGWGQHEDRRKTADAGFDGHLVKPVDYAMLEKLLSGLPASGMSSRETLE